MPTQPEWQAAVADRDEHLAQVRQAALALADKFPLSYWRDCDREEKYPWDFVKAFAAAGWMGIMMPEEHGGMGLGVSEAAVMLHEIGASGAGMSGASAIHFYVFPPAPIGIGRAALRLAVDYANSRVVFDRPIGRNQAVAHPLAQCWMQLLAAEMVTMKAAQLYDAGMPCGAESNTAKYLGAEAGFQACDQAMQTLGGYAYAKEYHLERLWREVRLLRLAPVSQEMVCNFVASKVLGLPRSY